MFTLVLLLCLAADREITVDGKVESVTKTHIVVKRAGGRTIKLAIDKSCPVRLDGRKSSVAAIRKGQDVRVAAWVMKREAIGVWIFVELEPPR